MFVKNDDAVVDVAQWSSTCSACIVGPNYCQKVLS